MADQLLAVPGQRVQAAERVLPVGLVEVAREHVAQQRVRRVQHGRVEIGGVREVDPHARECPMDALLDVMREARRLAASDGAALRDRRAHPRAARGRRQPGGMTCSSCRPARSRSSASTRGGATNSARWPIGSTSRCARTPLLRGLLEACRNPCRGRQRITPRELHEHADAAGRRPASAPRSATPPHSTRSTPNSRRFTARAARDYCGEHWRTLRRLRGRVTRFDPWRMSVSVMTGCWKIRLSRTANGGEYGRESCWTYFRVFEISPCESEESNGGDSCPCVPCGPRC